MPKGNNVFISYSSQDKNIANATCNRLEKENIRCWVAPRDINPGEDYGEAIINAIQKCKIMIVIFTRNANESKFVKKEVERAVSKGAIIIPIKFQNIIPSKSMEFFLSSAHWLDAMSPPIEEHLSKLVTTVKQLLNDSNNILSEPLLVKTTKDKDDIKLFNEIAPDNWYSSPKNNFSK